MTTCWQHPIVYQPIQFSDAGAAEKFERVGYKRGCSPSLLSRLLPSAFARFALALSSSPAEIRRDWPKRDCSQSKILLECSFRKNKCRSSSSDKECPTEIQRARGQCYDGEAAKAGEKTGVATQIKNINGKCLYAHCYGHASNLAVADAIKSVQCISDSLDTVRQIGKLLRKWLHYKTIVKASYWAFFRDFQISLTSQEGSLTRCVISSQKKKSLLYK